MKKSLFGDDIGLYARWLGIYYISLIVGTMNLGSIGSLLKLIGFIPIGIWLLKSRRVRLSRMILYSILFVMWVALTCLWSIDESASFSRTISQVSLLLMLFSAAGSRFTDAELDFLKKCLVWSSRITAAAVLISASYLQGRIYLDGIVKEDPNYLCAYFSFAIVFLLSTLLAGKTTGRQKILMSLELLIYAYIVIGTGSRGGLFAIVAAVGIVILFARSANNEKTYMGRRIGVVILLLIAAYLATKFINTDVLSRFSVEDIEESGGTGRYEMWENVLRAFSESDILRKFSGYGTGTARQITYLFSFPRHNVIHNMFLENLIEAGLFGLFFYVLHIGSFFAAAIKRKNLFCIAVISCMIVLSLSTSIYTFKPYWNIMLFILCLSNRKTEEDEQKKVQLNGGSFALRF